MKPRIRTPELDCTPAAAQAAGMRHDLMCEAMAYAIAHESDWPRSMRTHDGEFILTSRMGEPPPHNRELGVVIPRGGPNGLVYRHGRRVAAWGDTTRPDMTFSVAKSYLALLAGIAWDDGLIRNLDEPLASSGVVEGFESGQNQGITWRHLLQQTSEWQGTLFEKPDSVDHHRTLADGHQAGKGAARELHAPGSYWEYNDVRVNCLALSLMRLFRRPLPEVLQERIMGPIGASSNWRWNGYRNSGILIDGVEMSSVPGGSHWGGGLVISSEDHARIALLVQQEGLWEGLRLLSAQWLEMMRQPCAIKPTYGFLWWLNTGRQLFEGLPADAYCAHGAGMHCLWISPRDGLVVVARWIDKPHLPALLMGVHAAVVRA